MGMAPLWQLPLLATARAVPIAAAAAAPGVVALPYLHPPPHHRNLRAAGRGTDASTATATTPPPLPAYPGQVLGQPDLTADAEPAAEGGADSGSNSSDLDMPQGDQPEFSFKDSRGLLPRHWSSSTNRSFYIQNRKGGFLQMTPDGAVSGVFEKNPFSIIVILSHFSYVVMSGYVSNRYLCMDPGTTKIYTRKDLHEDCYMTDHLKNQNLQYYFNRSRSEGEHSNCFLGLFDNGTLPVGRLARSSQKRTQWLTLPVPPDELESAQKQREEVDKHGWTPPTPAPTTPRPVDRKEQRRKRVRRWCRNLSVMIKNPSKFLTRCQQDCEVLRDMLDNHERSQRRCLLNHVRRKQRHEKLKEAARLGKERRRKVRVDKHKARKEVKKLLPQAEAIFQWQRHTRRCNREREKRGKPRCSRKEVRRMIRRRSRQRSSGRVSPQPPADPFPADSSSSLEPVTVASGTTTRPQPGSVGPHKMRHRRKKTKEARKRSDVSASGTGGMDLSLPAASVRQQRRRKRDLGDVGRVRVSGRARRGRDAYGKAFPVVGPVRQTVASVSDSPAKYSPSGGEAVSSWRPSSSVQDSRMVDSEIRDRLANDDHSLHKDPLRRNTYLLKSKFVNVFTVR